MIRFRLLHSLLNARCWMLNSECWLLTLHSLWGRLPAAGRENTFSKGLSISHSSLFVGYRRNTSIVVSGTPLLTSVAKGTIDYPAVDSRRIQRLGSAETRLANPLPSDSRIFFFQYSGFHAARHSIVVIRYFFFLFDFTALFAFIVRILFRYFSTWHQCSSAVLFHSIVKPFELLVTCVAWKPLQ
jgi:hypothetical protein